MASAAYYTGCEYKNYESHFLDSCFLCNRSLSQNHDIFMYRGNTPFCSQECRQEQIEMDEADEKRWKISTSRSKLNSESAKETDTNKAIRAGTVAVA
ncbi:hypothetical protein CASFOL_041724 [Castilleja foliolosa]|uniref:FLZ-type domain-containing protein n=1 Tax=Castilleja foliolosa TaxID=1961234 RepID=A0ABD3B8G2_9LAMI